MTKELSNKNIDEITCTMWKRYDNIKNQETNSENGEICKECNNEFQPVIIKQYVTYLDHKCECDKEIESIGLDIDYLKLTCPLLFNKNGYLEIDEKLNEYNYCNCCNYIAKSLLEIDRERHNLTKNSLIYEIISDYIEYFENL